MEASPTCGLGGVEQVLALQLGDAQGRLDGGQLVVGRLQPVDLTDEPGQIRAVVVAPGLELARDHVGDVLHVDQGLDEGGRAAPVLGPRDGRRPGPGRAQPVGRPDQQVEPEVADGVVGVGDHDVAQPLAGLQARRLPGPANWGSWSADDPVSSHRWDAARPAMRRNGAGGRAG
jgi:hypothetical protein